MGENQYAVSDKYRVSWGNIDSVRLDSPRIKAERPEIYADSGKPSHYRRVEVKAA